MTRADTERWARELQEVVTRIAPRFGRVEPHRRALAYLLTRRLFAGMLRRIVTLPVPSG
jgi:hypothetical protein